MLLMGHIKGITIILYDRTVTGKDAFNHDIVEETPVLVDNVLVYPIESSASDGGASYDVERKHSRYTLGIPKGDTHVWDDRIVEFFGHKWKTESFSYIGIEEMIPLSWNRKVTVERYE